MRMLVLAAFAALSGCATVSATGDTGGAATVAPAREVTVTNEQDGRAIAVAPGGVLKVELMSAAGTPYEWVVLETPAFLRLASSEKIATPQAANAEPIVGGPVTNRFVFQATGSGSGQLRLALRSFVGDREVARTWNGTITVR